MALVGVELEMLVNKQDALTTRNGVSRRRTRNAR